MLNEAGDRLRDRRDPDCCKGAGDRLFLRCCINIGSGDRERRRRLLVCMAGDRDVRRREPGERERFLIGGEERRGDRERDLE